MVIFSSAWARIRGLIPQNNTLFAGQSKATALAVCAQIVLIAVITAAIYAVFHAFLVSQLGRITQNGFWVLFISFALALMLWSQLFFKAGVFQAWFIKVKPGYICVLKKGTAGIERWVRDGLHGKLPGEFVAAAAKEVIKVEKPGQPQPGTVPNPTPLPAGGIPFTLSMPEYPEAKVEEAMIVLGPKTDSAKSSAKWALAVIPIAAIATMVVFLRMNPSRPDESKWTLISAEEIGLTNAPSAPSPTKKDNVEKIIITDQGWREVCINGRSFTAKCNPPVPRVVIINDGRRVDLKPNEDPVFTERVHTLRYIVRYGYGNSCLTVTYN